MVFVIGVILWILTLLDYERNYNQITKTELAIKKVEKADVSKFKYIKLLYRGCREYNHFVAYSWYPKKSHIYHISILKNKSFISNTVSLSEAVSLDTNVCKTMASICLRSILYTMYVDSMNNIYSNPGFEVEGLPPIPANEMEKYRLSGMVRLNGTWYYTKEDQPYDIF